MPGSPGIRPFKFGPLLAEDLEGFTRQGSLLPNTLQFIVSHPLNRRRPVSALARFVAWQVGSRLKRDHVHRWISGTRLAVRSGMTGATGNIYCGLHEFADMALVIHALRPGDLFLDIGANVGSYTVLASGVCGARTIAFEPDPVTAVNLRRNVTINTIDHLVEVHESALGAHAGEVAFTVGQDTINRVAGAGDGQTRLVRLSRLDDIAGAQSPTLIKLDVEGYEDQVLAGAAAVLAAPSLLAIETEAQDSRTIDVIKGFGFVRRFYDPWTRRLSTEPSSLHASNALFVRNEPALAARLREAPRRQIGGHDL